MMRYSDITKSQHYCNVDEGTAGQVNRRGLLQTWTIVLWSWRTSYNLVILYIRQYMVKLGGMKLCTQPKEGRLMEWYHCYTAVIFSSTRDSVFGSTVGQNFKSKKQAKDRTNTLGIICGGLGEGDALMIFPLFENHWYYWYYWYYWYFVPPWGNLLN